MPLYLTIAAPWRSDPAGGRNVRALQQRVLRPDRHDLVIVWETDLHRNAHRVAMHDGVIDRVTLGLQATDWIGKFPMSDRHRGVA